MGRPAALKPLRRLVLIAFGLVPMSACAPASHPGNVVQRNEAESGSCAAGCAWTLEEIIDVSAPSALVGTPHVAGRNHVFLNRQADGSLAGQARFAWKEWLTGMSCEPSGNYLEDVNVTGVQTGDLLRLVISRAEIGFHQFTPCPGDKGFQRIDLPTGEMALTLKAVPGAILGIALTSPLAGIHRFILREPGQDRAGAAGTPTKVPAASIVAASPSP